MLLPNAIDLEEICIEKVSFASRAASATVVPTIYILRYKGSVGEDAHLTSPDAGKGSAVGALAAGDIERSSSQHL